MYSDRVVGRRDILKGFAALGTATASRASAKRSNRQAGSTPSREEHRGLHPLLLTADSFKTYVDYFNGMVPEEVINYIPNAQAWTWMRDNVPYFSCPDRQLEQTSYYRWWTYRKNIKQTPKGFIVTEFLKPVKHATEYNAISCAFGHHLTEGRWIHDARFMDEYTSFWLKSGENGGLQPRFHQFSGWAAAASYERWLVTGDTRFLVQLLDSLTLDYRTWQRDRRTPNGLFWQSDVADGMESSISGGRKVKNVRPTINSYMYGNAVAISAIARLAGNEAAAVQYLSDANQLRQLVQQKLWNSRTEFFETLLESGKLADVREEIGFTPWSFNLPDADPRYSLAWKQLMDPKGFFAPYGLTTAEQRDPRCRIEFSGDDCQWNGPVWPFSTSITLRALANLLNSYQQDVVSRSDYFATLIIYAQSQTLLLRNGQRIPWIDENLDPFTGEWLARERKIEEGTFYGRGNHYNHSTFADPIITGLVGLRPRSDETVEVNPLLPAGKWESFCLDNVLYHGHLLTIVWDRTGTKFQKGAGLRVFANGAQIAQGDELARVSGRLPPV
jgi:hypothetical protein